MKSLYQKTLSVVLWLGSRNRRVLAVDVLLLLLSVYIGYALRFSYFIGDELVSEVIRTGVLFTASVIFALLVGKIYTILWPRASIEEYARFVKCYSAGIALFIFINMMFQIVTVPRSTLLFLSLFGIVFLTGARAVWRLAIAARPANAPSSERVLIIGAGEAGAMLARDLLRHGSVMLPLGFIDDNNSLKGMNVASLKVLGGKDVILQTVKEYCIDTVLIAIPSATGAQIKEYMDLLNKARVKVRVLPSLLTLADGQVSVNRLRSVNLEDLLRRDPIKLDNENIKSLIKGKTVLVTGAGGSIGSEICRQVLARAPKRLLALGHGENSIYMLLESLIEEGNEIEVIPVIADVADGSAMRALFEKWRPQVVFHAGAHKHVPLMEENPCESLRVNAFGTWNTASLAGEYGVERFVMISTDKAVHPTSVMGATKRTAERLLLKVQQQYPDTKYMAVRFGNVLGSRGSVVPKFERQIAAGGPVTVTHPEMKRYFMLIPEAVSLVLQACTMGDGGELFVLDMGKPVKISEMAETLIRLHGYEPGKDIKIEYSGIRPGEKLYEELFYDPTHVETTLHEKIYRTRLTPDTRDVFVVVQNVLEKYSKGNITIEQIKDIIFKIGNE